MSKGGGVSAKPDGSQRMRMWRERQRREGFAQVFVWVRREHETALRTIFEKLADPDWIGEAYRATVAPWLTRNRPPARTLQGRESRSEIDRPLLDAEGGLQPIGGRLFGAGGEFVELTPAEAADLDERIRTALDTVHEGFVHDHGLQGCIRDLTGVVTEQDAHHARRKPTTTREYSVERPGDEMQFKASESAIAGDIVSFGEGVIEDLGEGCFLFGYAGLDRFPSRCLVVTSLQHPEFQISPSQPLVALVKLDHNGTPPAACFARLAGEVLDAVLPGHRTDAVWWYDAARNMLSPTQALHVTRVVLENDGRGYSNPTRVFDDLPNRDFLRFVRQILVQYETRRPTAGARAASAA